MPAVIAVKRACAERIRPVMLTSCATVVGLVPAMLEININLFRGGIEFGSVTSSWWVQFVTALVFGLSFATLLTLIVVPTMLAAPSVIRNRWRSYETRSIAGYVQGQRVADRASRLLERQPSGKA
jgi:multidrug efflux pump